MAKRRDEASEGPRRELTFTERARRGQLIESTIELVADNGYAGTSLAGIAEHAGITKAAVLYHFPSKDALVRDAYGHVLGALVSEIAAVVGAAEVADGPAAYVRSMIGYLRDHPRHTRMIVEAMSHGDGDHASNARWGPLAEIITAAQSARGVRAGDARTIAIIVGGAIDAIVAERLHDPGYDTVTAAERLVQIVDVALAL
ncbi:TetR/AcrR family transcriptional regulator [Micromonospora cremea]|uniref:DNA-binding transcriptional regulator, AcrR family n=1 Tax=Micromonospora cremea TaxID=709881 RepID=A0A1N5TFI0_9ACTN|nr:TetR/AcrR family transcriptional regulator [Micromonospora cremea]SIM47180.1 DNA-binding transcriptional regulator, AcrR family [Micromonospora cremea]